MSAPPPIGFDALPEVIPVFPLSGVLLFPRRPLPLHIFEPRYRDMVRAAVATDGMIGMIQPLEHESRSARPDLYPTGCVGRVTGLRETEDGRFYLTLYGICRYTIVDELPMTHAFRQVRVSYAGFRRDLDPGTDIGLDRDVLFDALRIFLDARELDADWKQIRDVDAETLVHALAMTCPFDPREKQALLESRTLADRANMLIALFRMNVSGAAPETLQ